MKSCIFAIFGGEIYFGQYEWKKITCAAGKSLLDMFLEKFDVPVIAYLGINFCWMMLLNDDPLVIQTS